MRVSQPATNEVVVALPLYELADAVKSDSVEAARSAIADGADPNGIGLTRLSMLQLAEKHLANSVVPVLLKAGANVDERFGANADTLLHRAARHENVGFVSIFLESGASPNTPNLRGETPLHVAARTGQEYLAKMLVKHGANVLCKDAKGRTPLDLADAAEHFSITRFLKPLIEQAEYAAAAVRPDISNDRFGDNEHTNRQEHLQTVNEPDAGHFEAESFAKRVRSPSRNKTPEK